MKRESYKQQQIADEQRKAGKLPAEVDAETGKDINPHIPRYITKAPWYVETGQPSLKHQRYEEKEEKEKATEIGVKRSKIGVASKYRKGACENCGSMSHKSKDCLDRPRKKGAKYTGKDILPDEHVETKQLGYDAKRDRWSGYNPEEYMHKTREWELLEEERKKIREQKAKEKIAKAAKTGKLGDLGSGTEDSDDSGDEEKYAENMEMVGQKLDEISRTTVRNLRIREDTAKYLLNLDANSAFYDPKSRSMRDNPLPNKDPTSLSYAGDNFVRYTGEAPEVAKLQVFAWEAAEHGKNIHLQANPSQAEMLYKQYQQKKEQLSASMKKAILEKYGGEEHLQAPPKELLLAQTENYVEYTQTGKLVKGLERAKVRSKYEEDVFPMNHSTVWGSFWSNGEWGYACCHETTKNSYCSGEAGKEAKKETEQLIQANLEKRNEMSNDKDLVEKKSLAMEHLMNLKSFDSKKPRPGGEDYGLDKQKLQLALDKERERIQRGAAPQTLNENLNVTEEELEAFRILQRRPDDPMYGYEGSD